MLTQITDATTPRKAPSLQNGLSRVSAAIFGVRSPPLSEETPYPLDPLSARELETATAAVKLHAASALAPGTPLRFNIVTLQVCTCSASPHCQILIYTTTIFREMFTHG